MHDNRIPLIQGAIIQNGTSAYKVRDHLGFGGASLVYLCECNDTVVAVKELYPKELEFSLQRDTDGKLSFAEGMNTQYAQDALHWHKRNMRSEASLHSAASQSRNMSNNDPFFIGCEGVFDYNGTTYCVYQTANGKPLNNYILDIKNRNAPGAYLAEILSILAITAKKLDCIHQAGLLHLDISPSNLYVIDHGNGAVPYLLDFGSACRINDDTTRGDHRFSVTNGFSAPELYCKSEGNHAGYPVTTATDTYGLVAVLFWSLCGKTYRECLCESDAWEKSIMDQYSYADMILQILKKGLGEQRSRYQSATELCNDLLEVLALLQGDITHTKAILAKINLLFGSYAQELREVINSSATFIAEHINERNEEVKKEIRKSKKHLLWGGVVLAVLAVSILAWLMLGDFSPPSISLIGVKKDSSGYICVEKNALTFCFEYRDNKDIDWQYVDERDILLDGFTAEKNFEHFDDGLYKLSLTNIKPISEDCSIVVKGGCAKDTSGKISVEERFPLKVFARGGDKTIPTIALSKPVGRDGCNAVKNGDKISFDLYLDDETELRTANISAEYIRACDFDYDEIIVNEADHKYTITFTNVTGSLGAHHIYIAPGTAIDAEGNYSKGLTSAAFYLYENEIDTTPPQVDISEATINGNSVEYCITVSDNMDLSSFLLRPENITLVGFTADISVDIGSTHSIRIIRLTNIQVMSDAPFFVVDSGVAVDTFGNKSKGKPSSPFLLP